MKWDGLMQRMSRGRCPCHFNHRTDNYQQKMENKRGKKQEEEYFYVINTFFGKMTSKNMKRFFFWKMEWRNLCCFEKKLQTQIQNPRKDLDNREHSSNILSKKKIEEKSLSKKDIWKNNLILLLFSLERQDVWSNLQKTNVFFLRICFSICKKMKKQKEIPRRRIARTFFKDGTKKENKTEMEKMKEEDLKETRKSWKSLKKRREDIWIKSV